jgi:predicted kinase
MLLVLSGPPCSGKSTLAAALRQRLGGVALDVDDIRTALIPGSQQSEADRDAAYAELHSRAKRLLRDGVSPVILSATYTRLAQRCRLAAMASEVGAAALVVQCAIDPGVAVARFAVRPAGHAAVDLTADAVRTAAAAYAFTTGEALVLDTTASLTECVERVVTGVEAGRTTSLALWCGAK